MAGLRKNGRDAGALIVSAVAHIVVLAILVSQAAPDYVLPEPAAQPMDVQIVSAPIMPPPPPPPVIPPKPTLKQLRTTAPPPPPAPPLPKPPTPTPAPETPKLAPAKAAPVKAQPVPVAPAPPKPVAAPAPPAAKPAPPKPAPAAPPAPAAVTAPAKLNIHKPEKDAPANIATLPMAPAPGQPTPGAPAAGGAPAGSRLSGLTPFPLGAMPSGGTGLRGTLVGCANADSVHLSPTERAHCSERFGVEIGRAPALDGIAPSKRAAFDKTAAEQEADRREGPVDPMTAMARKHGKPTDFGGGVVSGPASSYVHP